MQLTITPQEAANLRKGLKSYIKHKKANVKNIQKNLADPEANEEVTAIRKGMLARRQADIDWANSLLSDLEHVEVTE